MNEYRSLKTNSITMCTFVSSDTLLNGEKHELVIMHPQKRIRPIVDGGCRLCGCREYVSPARGTEICVNCGHGKQYH